MKVLVLGLKSPKLQAELRNQGALVDAIYPENLEISILNGELSFVLNGLNLCEYDLILVRRFAADFAGAEERALLNNLYEFTQNASTLVINSPRSILLCIDKAECSLVLNKAGIPTPKTVVTTQVEPEILEKYFEQLGKKVVVKPLFGAKGRGILVVEDIDSLVSLAQRAYETRTVLYLQEFIETIDNQGLREDWRVFVANDEVIGAMKRRSESFITNLHRGGAAVSAPLTEEIEELALKASKSCGTFYSGVDFLIDEEGQPLIVEVNSIPGWMGLSQVYKRNFAGVLAEIFVNAIKSG